MRRIVKVMFKKRALQSYKQTDRPTCNVRLVSQYYKHIWDQVHILVEGWIIKN